MQSFSYDSVRVDDSEVKLTYPIPKYYSMKLITPTECFFFPMETGEYAQFRLPQRSVDLLQGFSTDAPNYQRIGDNALPFKIASLFHLPKITEQFYIGRSLSSYVCYTIFFLLLYQLLYTFSLVYAWTRKKRGL